MMTYMFKAIHYYLQIYLKTLEISVLKYELDPAHFFVCTRISMASMFKKVRVRIINKMRIINRYYYDIDG